MTVRSQIALAGVILLALCGAAQAKSAACACHLMTKNVQHAAVHRTTKQVSKTAHHAYAARATQKNDRANVRTAREGMHAVRRNVLQRDGRYDSRGSESNATASRETRNDYDYSRARQAREDVTSTRQTYGRQDEQNSYRQDQYSSGYGDYRGLANGRPAVLNRGDQYDYRQDQYSYGYGDYRGQAEGPPVTLNGRDFSGGVGYGQSGDMGYYQGGGYGRFNPYNGNTAGMNGGVVNDPAAARMSVWHGYNGHNGLGNGY